MLRAGHQEIQRQETGAFVVCLKLFRKDLLGR